MLHFTAVLLGGRQLRGGREMGETDSRRDRQHKSPVPAEAWALWESQDDDNPADTEELMTSRIQPPPPPPPAQPSCSQSCSYKAICAALKTGPPQRSTPPWHCILMYRLRETWWATVHLCRQCTLYVLHCDFFTGCRASSKSLSLHMEPCQLPYLMSSASGHGTKHFPLSNEHEVTGTQIKHMFFFKDVKYLI